MIAWTQAHPLLAGLAGLVVLYVGVIGTLMYLLIHKGRR